MGLLALLTLWTPSGTVAAQIEDKRAEAASIATKLNEQAGRIVSLDIDFRNAQHDLADAEASVKKAEADLAAATRRQNELKQSLVLQAQDAYVVGGSVSVIGYLISTKQGDEVVRRAYLRMVSGQDRKLIGQLKAVREDLGDLGKRLEAARRRAGARADAIADDKVDLDKAVRTQRAVLAQVNGELVALVAAEQSRRDAEAAQLAAAAAAASRQIPTAASTPAAAAPVVLEAPSGDVWACIRQLESGNNYASPSGGAYQFLDGTWQSLGYSGQAEDHPPAVQDQAARELQARSGWSQWTVAPLCGRA
ncbi:MAG: transglycosylase family protein [Acidimicrobiales bacterium]